jgi:hypothetical protein
MRPQASEAAYFRDWDIDQSVDQIDENSCKCPRLPLTPPALRPSGVSATYRTLGEVTRIAKRREDAGPLMAREGDITDSAVLKERSQMVIANDNRAPHVDHGEDVWPVRQLVSGGGRLGNAVRTIPGSTPRRASSRQTGAGPRPPAL